MFNLSRTVEKFYEERVSLAGDTKKTLREKKDLNVRRLKDGLKDYNKDHFTNYKIEGILEQGSVAMTTVTKNEENDFDIDVAIIFDEDNIGDITPRAIKNVVVEALKNKCTNFKTPPEALTNCVRIVYADNYHIDFAIYRSIKQYDGSFKYEHAGSEWRPRDPRAINKWFYNKKKDNGDCLNKVIKLSKMFCKSRSEWIMPGGLIQTILVAEQISKYKNEERLDKLFYDTMVAIRDRLEYNTKIINPTDRTQSILLKQSHEKTMNTFKNRLTTHLNKLDVLFEKDCTLKKAMNAWNEFFNNDFWEDSVINECSTLMNFNRDTYEMYAEISTSSVIYNEEIIENLYPVSLRNYISLNCFVERNGSTIGDLKTMLILGRKLRVGDKLYFHVKSSNIHGEYDTLLKVKNIGAEAIRNNNLRGDIFDIRSFMFMDNKYHVETCKYRGEHFIECYAIKNGVCIAKDSIRVPIE